VKGHVLSVSDNPLSSVVPCCSSRGSLSSVGLSHHVNLTSRAAWPFPFFLSFFSPSYLSSSMDNRNTIVVEVRASRWKLISI
jgi:hypothetical protein